MTVEALMTQAVTVLTPTTFTQDDTGEVIDDNPTSVSTLMYLEPVKGREEQLNRDTPIADWIGYGNSADLFRSDCRVIYGEHVLQVVGDPRLKWNPRTGAFSHVEMDLQEIDDSEAFAVHVDATAHPDAVEGIGG